MSTAQLQWFKDKVEATSVLQSLQQIHNILEKTEDHDGKH